MKTQLAPKPKHAAPSANSLERRREAIQRKAAAVNRCWSAGERRLRSELARQLQLRLFATIVQANCQTLSVA